MGFLPGQPTNKSWTESLEIDSVNVKFGKNRIAWKKVLMFTTFSIIIFFIFIYPQFLLYFLRWDLGLTHIPKNDNKRDEHLVTKSQPMAGDDCKTEDCSDEIKFFAKVVSQAVPCGNNSQHNVTKEQNEHNCKAMFVQVRDGLAKVDELISELAGIPLKQNETKRRTLFWPEAPDMILNPEQVKSLVEYYEALVQKRDHDEQNITERAESHSRVKRAGGTLLPLQKVNVTPLTFFVDEAVKPLINRIIRATIDISSKTDIRFRRVWSRGE